MNQKPRYNQLIDEFCDAVSVVNEGDEVVLIQVKGEEVIVPLKKYEETFFNKDEQEIFERYHEAKEKRAVEFIVFRSENCDEK